MKWNTLLVLICLSCSFEKKNESLLTSFEDKKVIHLSSQKIPIQMDGLIFENLSQIKYIDGLLFAVDPPGREYCMKIINLKNKRIRNFLKKGRGPGEIRTINPSVSYNYEKKELVVTDNINYFTYLIDNLKNGIDVADNKLSLKFDKAERLFDAIYCNDGYMLGSLMKSRLGFVNVKKSDFIKKFDYSEGFMVEQGKFYSNPIENKAIHLETYNARLWVINYNLKDIYLKEKKWWKSNIKQITLPNGSITTESDGRDRIAFIGATGSSKYLYTIYSGKRINFSNAQDTFSSRVILVFDWEGNPVKSYQLDNKALSIAIDEKNNILYAGAIDKEGELSLIKYNLD